MTTAEQTTINEVFKLMNAIREENKKFREDMDRQAADNKARVDKKLTPLYLEADILSTAQTAIADAIKLVMTGYQSPLTKLVAVVVNEHDKELKTLISDAFTQVIRTEDFKKSIVSAFSHKVARSIISNNDGLYDKVANELKTDTVFKSKMALAVANVVEECLVKR
jgi:hypothetical protein